MHAVAAIVAILPALAAASPLAKRAITFPYSAEWMALRSASPIHFQSLNANSRLIWIGKETNTDCDAAVADCESYTNTTSITLSSGNAYMNVDVAGGQQLYVAPSGALEYTAPHSADMVEGSFVGGWGAYTSDSGVDMITTSAGSATGFLACPTKDLTSPYQVFAAIDGIDNSAVPSGNVGDCLGFDIAASVVDDATAYEYL